jgi:hypothetical protein
VIVTFNELVFIPVTFGMVLGFAIGFMLGRTAKGE